MQGALQRVAVVSETTTLEFIESLLGSSVEVDRKATHDEAFAALAAGAVTYYFAYRALLNAVVGRAANAGDFIVGGKFMPYEPYALPFAKARPPDVRQSGEGCVGQGGVGTVCSSGDA